MTSRFHPSPRLRCFVADTISFTPTGEETLNVRLAEIPFWVGENQTPKTRVGFTFPQRVGVSGIAAGRIVDMSEVFNVSTSRYRFQTPIINQLVSTGWTPSMSWGLHVGFVNAKVSPSLVLGGYDRNRVIGDIIPGGLDSNTSQLLDVRIATGSGVSPLNTTLTPSLLDAGANTTIEVIVSPETPYMSLPGNTCKAIASWLPVTFWLALGLYTWDIYDPLYMSIITSGLDLSFSFVISPMRNASIRVPFALLNLTLESPLSDQPIPYFPCLQNAPWNGSWRLVRAFLQAA